jgi:hypothetical protein
VDTEAADLPFVRRWKWSFGLYIRDVRVMRQI